jgi:hypothetical protein
MTLRPIHTATPEALGNSQCIRRPPNAIILRAIRYRAVLRAWAFRPELAPSPGRREAAAGRGPLERGYPEGRFSPLDEYPAGPRPGGAALSPRRGPCCPGVLEDRNLKKSRIAGVCHLGLLKCKLRVVEAGCRLAGIGLAALDSESAKKDIPIYYRRSVPMKRR